jgi:hypothetical protein
VGAVAVGAVAARVARRLPRAAAGGPAAEPAPGRGRAGGDGGPGAGGDEHGVVGHGAGLPRREAERVPVGRRRVAADAAGRPQGLRLRQGLGALLQEALGAVPVARQVLGRRRRRRGRRRRLRWW